MSNLRSTGQMPLKTTMTNKWKAQAPNSETLERQTRALEESLNKLKLAMHPEKAKAAHEIGAPIWEKGKTGPMSQYANHVLRDDPRRVLDVSKPTKIRVLVDEPAVPVVRPSLVTNLQSPKTSAKKKAAKCGQCERDEAKMKCLECAESYCTACFAQFHLRGALQRHRCVPLTDSRPTTPQTKKSTVGADVIFKELRHAQSKDDLFRKSTLYTDVLDDDDDEDGYDPGEGGQLLTGNYDEKNSAASFQQALAQWRQGDTKSSPQKVGKKKSKATHETGVDTVHDADGRLNQVSLPHIEFRPSKLTYGEKLLLKKYRRATRNKQNFFQQPSPRAKTLAESLNLDGAQIEIEPLYDELTSERTVVAEEVHFDDGDEDEELLRLKNQERTKSRASSKAPSRPSSVALFQHPLPSLLATNPGDDLKAIVGTPSRPSSAASKKATKFDSRLPAIWNRNWKPEQSVFNDSDKKPIQIDHQAVTQFDSVLDDLLDESKIGWGTRSDSAMTTVQLPPSGRQSPFNFTDPPRKVDSSSSLDLGDGGFFTDVPPRKPRASPTIPTLMSLRKSSMENFSPSPPKRSTTLEETRQQLDEQSRPGSSLSSTSLPVSVMSSQPELITRMFTERHPKVAPAPLTTTSTKKFRVEFTKKSAAPTIAPMVVEGKKVTSARNSARDTDPHLQQSMTSSRSKMPADVQKSANTTHLLKTSSTSSVTTITHLSQDPSKARKMEFSVRDGVKWQAASTELGASKNVTSSTPRPSTPSNPNNSKLAKQFRAYDNDDGRSSRACQDVDDEEYCNQLREELCSELDMASPGWDASLSDHVLKNLRATDAGFSEKELQDHLTLLEIKLRENESDRQSQTDEDRLIHDEIRNL